MAVTATKRKPPQPDPMGRRKAVAAITAGDVERYAELCLLEHEKAELRKKLLAAREAKLPIPRGDTHEITFIESERRTIKWENEASELAERYMGAAEREEWRYDVLERAEVTEVVSVKAVPRKDVLLEAISAN